MKTILSYLAFCSVLILCPVLSRASETKRPHILFVMADDMGWGQTGYRGHPVLKTPNLDEMAASGLRFERFYAGGPVCSPTRASVLTGRSHERTGVLTHGYALRTQEKTIAQALKNADYVTGHFGKWHLNGHRGPGVPIFADDPYSPGKFGFDQWVSVSNFCDVDPLMSRTGKFEQMQGDSSEIAVNEAVKFLEEHRPSGKPMFAVVWFGTPHSPFKALDADKAAFRSGNSAGSLRASLTEPSLPHCLRTTQRKPKSNFTMRLFGQESGRRLRCIRATLLEMELEYIQCRVSSLTSPPFC